VGVDTLIKGTLKNLLPNLNVYSLADCPEIQYHMFVFLMQDETGAECIFHYLHHIVLYKHPALMLLGHSTASIVRLVCLFGIALGTDFIHVMF
jgi:hypothetical protein